MKCMICGKEVKHNHYSEHSDFFGLCGDTKCFNKRFWQLALDDKAIIINRTCYHVGKKQTDSRYTADLGFDVRVFHIKMLDTGDVITTNNLRCNGKVSTEYAVEDNAVFLNK